MWSQAFQLLFLPILLHFVTAAIHLATPSSGSLLIKQGEHLHKAELGSTAHRVFALLIHPYPILYISISLFFLKFNNTATEQKQIIMNHNTTQVAHAESKQFASNFDAWCLKLLIRTVWQILTNNYFVHSRRKGVCLSYIFLALAKTNLYPHMAQTTLTHSLHAEDTHAHR